MSIKWGVWYVCWYDNPWSWVQGGWHHEKSTRSSCYFDTVKFAKELLQENANFGTTKLIVLKKQFYLICVNRVTKKTTNLKKTSELVQLQRKFRSMIKARQESLKLKNRSSNTKSLTKKNCNEGAAKQDGVKLPNVLRTMNRLGIDKPIRNEEGMVPSVVAKIAYSLWWGRGFESCGEVIYSNNYQFISLILPLPPSLRRLDHRNTRAQCTHVPELCPPVHLSTRSMFNVQCSRSTVDESKKTRALSTLYSRFHPRETWRSTQYRMYLQ